MIPAYVRHLAGRARRAEHAGRSSVKDDGGHADVRRGARLWPRRGGEAMAAAIARCRQTGVVAMTLANAHHIGRVGAYGELAIAAGLVSLHFVNVSRPPRPRRAFLGNRCALLDESRLHRAARHRSAAACAARHGHELRVGDGQDPRRQERGQAGAEGVAIDPSGEPTRDPNVMYSEPHGALLPFGGHKGYALAVVTELLAGALSGGPTHPARQRAARRHRQQHVHDPGRPGAAWPASTGSAARSTASWTTSRPRRRRRRGPRAGPRRSGAPRSRGAPRTGIAVDPRPGRKSSRPEKMARPGAIAPPWPWSDLDRVVAEAGHPADELGGGGEARACRRAARAARGRCTRSG